MSRQLHFEFDRWRGLLANPPSDSKVGGGGLEETYQPDDFVERYMFELHGNMLPEIDSHLYETDSANPRKPR